MDRLTTRINDKVRCIGKRDGHEITFELYRLVLPHEGVDYIEKMLERLARYEDTGLTPDEIYALCSMDRRARMAEQLRKEENEEAEKRRNKILQDAVRIWGRDAQSLMMIEEMSELTKAICKFYRAEDDASARPAIENIREEMADVQIMLDQMKIMFGYADDQERAKLDRLEKRLEASHAKERG